MTITAEAASGQSQVQGALTQTLGLCSTAFLGHYQEAGSEVAQQGLEPAPMWNASVVGGGFTCYTMTPTLDDGPGPIP